MNHVYVIDDNTEVASSLSATLQHLGFSTEVYNDPVVFLQQSLPLSPAAILLDMRMPSMTGVTLQKRLLEIGRKTPIIFISGDSQPQEIIEGMKQGAVDFLIKPFNLEELLTALQAALDKDRANTQSLLVQLSLQERYNSLTAREKEVCALLVEGALSKAIALDLGISEATVKVHKSRIMEKMQANSLQQLARDMLQLVPS
jgi:FixJ family two-component response regulator